jgi:hypothetical protein
MRSRFRSVVGLAPSRHSRELPVLEGAQSRPEERNCF